MVTRDDLIREYRNKGGSFVGLAVVYLSLLATLVLTAMAIV